MSAALLRQALEFVADEEVDRRKSKKAPSRLQRSFVQDHRQFYKQKGKRTDKKIVKTSSELAEENIKKLLALSQPTADSVIAEKIVQRAAKGKALADKIEVSKEEPKSILFPEETFGNFEKEYFCSCSLYTTSECNVMEIPDAVVGKAILVLSSVIFLLISFWINTYPFIDEDLPIHKLIPNPKWFLLVISISGSVAVGGLMIFTLYHINPYL